MLPATMTVTSIFAQGTDVVGNFGPLIVLVVGLGFGLWVVKKLPAMIKRSRS